MQNSMPKRRDDILTQESGDEIMLYDPTADELHILNPTAQLIWELCDGTHSVEQITAEVRGKFTVAADIDVAGDVAQTLSEFANKKLLL